MGSGEDSEFPPSASPDPAALLLLLFGIVVLARRCPLHRPTPSTIRSICSLPFAGALLSSMQPGSQAGSLSRVRPCFFYRVRVSLSHCEEGELVICLAESPVRHCTVVGNRPWAGSLRCFWFNWGVVFFFRLLLVSSSSWWVWGQFGVFFAREAPHWATGEPRGL